MLKNSIPDFPQINYHILKILAYPQNIIVCIFIRISWSSSISTLSLAGKLYLYSFYV